MQDAPIDQNLINVLNELMDVELSSVFQLLEDNAPYLSRTTAPFRRPLSEMVAASHRRVGEFAKLIDELGGTPIPRGLQVEEQNVAYLSLRYLLPRLIGAKKIAIARWESALNRLRNCAPAATTLLHDHLAEHRKDQGFLEHAYASVS